MVAFSKKLSVLGIQQREHSSCPLLGSPSLHSPSLFLFLPWTCQQHQLRNIALTSTASPQSLNEEVGDRHHINKIYHFLSVPVKYVSV